MSYEVLETESKGYEVIEPEQGYEIIEPEQTSTATTAPVTTPTLPGDINQLAGQVPDMQATTRGGPRVAVASAKETIGSLAQESQMTEGSGGIPFGELAASLNMTPEDIMRSAGAFLPGSPEPTKQQLEFAKSSLPLQFLAGMDQGAAELAGGVAQYFTSKQGLTEVAATKTPIAPAVFLKWAKDMVEGGMINFDEALSAYRRGDIREFGKHATTGLGMLVGAGGIVKGGVTKAQTAATELVPRGQGIASPELTRLAPATAQAVTETAKDTNASKITSPTEVPELGIRPRVGPEAPLRQQGQVTETLTPATDQAVTETPSSAPITEPRAQLPLEQKSIPLEGPAPEAGVGGGMSTKSLSDQARQAEANRKMQEEFGAESAAAPDLRQGVTVTDDTAKQVWESFSVDEKNTALPGEGNRKWSDLGATDQAEIKIAISENLKEKLPDTVKAVKQSFLEEANRRFGKTRVPDFAKRYDPETLFQRPAWVEPGSMLDKVLGKTREQDWSDQTNVTDISPIWKTLTPEQRQDLIARGWNVHGTRDPKVVALLPGKDALAARRYYAMQTKQALKQSTPSAIATPGPEAKGETAGAISTPGPPLGPMPAGSTPLTPKSQRQIITDIAKGLKLPIRFGRLTTNKFAGYFKDVANLIGSKKADDIPVVSHEAGHKLDKTFGLSADPSLIPELNVLGDPATPGSRSSWTKSKSKKYKLGEGVAEFVRHWLTDPAHAKTVAPNTFTAFERALDTNKDFGDTMRQAQQDIALWRSADPQARLRSQISVGENPNKTKYTASQLTRDLVDDLHILRLATIDAAPKGTKLDPSSDPYLLARNLRGSYGMAATFIRDGVVDFKTKEVRMGTSLEDALKPVAGRLNDFRDWIVAKRAQELRAQGRESGLVSTDVDAVAKKFDADPEFQRAFTAVKNWNDALLDYAVDADLIQKGSPRTATSGPTGSYAIREMNQDYVPFHRVFEIGAGESPSQSLQGIGMGLNVGKPGSLKGLKGSTRQIVDPLETMVKNAYTIITASEKAAINTAVADLSKLPDMGKWVERIAAPKERVPVELERIKKQLEDAGADLTAVPDDLLMAFFRQSRSAPFGENIIRVVRNGNAEFYRLNKELHDTFQALDLEDTGKLLRMLASPSQLLRAGVTLDPAFSFANVMRDTFSAAVIGKYGAFPFETTLKGMAAMVNNPKLVAEWAASGGKSAVEASYFDRTKLQQFLAERISKDLTPAERALIVARSPLSALRWLSSAFEESTRIGEYKIAYEQLRKSGMPEGEARRQAAFEARDRQDFAKGGAKTKIVRHLAAFWNAGLQANVKLAQAFKERPLRTTLQGLAFITIPKLLEQAINWDDEDYWARKQWERDMFFLIPIGKDASGHTRFLRIPTPFEVGVIFGTMPGRMLQSMRENNPEAMKSFPSLMLKQSVPNPIPQAGQVIFEDFLSGKKGWDVWRGRTIVPESLADEPPELQWTEQTSGIAKKAGEVLKFSPMKIDHLIERTTGGMGKLLTGRSVPGQRFVTAPLSVSNQATETFYDRLEAIREDAALAKAANKSAPAGYTQFQATERTLSALRKRVRETKDLDQKARLQEQMLRITTDFLKNHPTPIK